jgi:hypothetical protein
MTTQEEWGEPDRLQALSETNQKLAAIEREWKHWRLQSKTLTLELITMHGYSVSKAAQLSGHHRNTIKIWLTIHNAETKSAQRPAGPPADQDKM